MAGTTTKTILAEIHVTFSTGMDHQTQPIGEVNGAHMITFETLVDDAGMIVGLTRNPKNGQAQSIDPEMVKGILGDQFAPIAAQLATKDATIADHVATITSQKEMIEGLQSKINSAVVAHSDIVKTLQA